MFLFHYNDLSPLKILVFTLSCHVSLFHQNHLSQLSFDHDQIIMEINRFVEKGTHDMITFFLSRSFFTKTAYLSWCSWLLFYHVMCSLFTKTTYPSWKPYLSVYHVTRSFFTKTIYLQKYPLKAKTGSGLLHHTPMSSPASHKPHTHKFMWHGFGTQGPE